jgi:hypothetical protein
MANQRFSRSTGRAKTPLTAVVLLVPMPRSDQEFYKVEDLFPTAGAPASRPLTGALTMHSVYRLQSSRLGSVHCAPVSVAMPWVPRIAFGTQALRR